LIFSKDPDWVVDVIDNPSPGYISFDWQSDSSYFLMNNYASFQFKKSTGINIRPFKLLSNGLWIAFGKKIFYLLNQDFQIIDSIPQPSNYGIDFHDVNLLSNGHYMILGFEKRTMDLSKIVDGGKTNASVNAAVLIETDRTGTIFWLWNSFDHYAITDVTPDVDLTMQAIDFTHANSFLEDSEGNILISLRHLDEISKIDRKTGNLLWRVGGTFCKNNQFVFVNDTINGFFGFSHQHSISLQSNGNILLYDNGNIKDPAYSRVVEYKMNFSNKTITKVWEYRPSPDVITPNMGTANRLMNGNTIITFGTAKTEIKILEVKPDKSIAFRLNFNGSQNQAVFFVTRYITKMNAVIKQINSKGNYIFNDSSFFTGIEILADRVIGSGLASIEKHNYPPPSAEFIDSNFASIYPYRWVFSKQNIDGISGTLKISIDSIENIKYPQYAAIYMRSQESKGAFKPLITNYNPNTKQFSASINNFGEFILVSCKLNKPALLFPANNQSQILTKNILRWNKLDGASNFQIQLSKFNSFDKTTIDDTVSGRIFRYNFNNLDFKTNYYWRVRGYNSKDTSEWSDIFMFTTIENIIFIPILLSPANNQGSISVNDSLIWEKVPAADSYIVEISVDPLFKSSNLDSLKVTDEFYIIKNAEHFTKYYWRVKSLNKTESTDWSEVWNFTTDISAPLLDLPKNKDINIQIAGTFIWGISNGANEYQLQISESNKFNSLLIDTTNLKVSEYDYKNLELNKEYFWRVRALRNSETSDWSEVWSFNTGLPAPQLLIPEKNQKGVAVNSYLSWNSEFQNALYWVQVSELPDFNFSVIDSSFITENKLLLTNLSSNRLYFWRVKLLLDKKESEWSEIRNFLSELEIPEVVSPLNNTIDINVDGKLKWNDKNNYSSYRCQISDDIDFANLIYNENSLKTMEFVYNLSYSTTYFWRVKVETPYNFSRWSDIVKFTTSAKTDVWENLQIDNFKIYPNPANDYIYIQPSEGLKPSEGYDIQIFDMLGILVLNTKYNPTPTLPASMEGVRVDVSFLSPGIYCIKIGNRVEIFVKM
jgi:hypothetical protein